jgi:phosphate-selective porin OprO and OprP
MDINVKGDTMKKWLWVVLVGLLVGPGIALGETDEDLKAQLAVLTAQLEAQQAQLDAIEQSRVTEAEQTRQDLLDILQEMDLSYEPTTFRVYWKNGIRMDSADGRFKLKFGGRIQYDFGVINGGDLEDAPDIGDLSNGAEARRARLYVSGTIYENIDFKLQFDFAQGDADLKDAYMQFNDILAIGRIRIGQFKEPFSLDELTSSKYITFMERGLPNDLAPGRNAGIMIGDHILDQRMTWATGLFYQVDDYGATQQDGGAAFTSRVTGLPWYEDDGAKLLHLGIAYSLRDSDDTNTIRYRARPEAHFTERFTDTGDFGADMTQLFGAEAAWVHGPLSLQAEYIGASVSGTDDGVGSPMFNSFYVQGSYFLTGEHRNYDRKKGAFKRVQPKRNFREDGGWGAWEVAARYSYLDLRASGLPDSARRLEDITLGVNWYINPNVRLMGNYIRSHVTGTDITGDADIFMLRMQVDF